jgi:hypothetical protein
MTRLSALSLLDVADAGNLSADLRIHCDTSWPSLLQLRIDNAGLSAELFSRLIACSPSLRALDISICADARAHWLSGLGECQNLERLALYYLSGISDDLQLPLSRLPGLKVLQVANMRRAQCSAVDIATSALLSCYFQPCVMLHNGVVGYAR